MGLMLKELIDYVDSMLPAVDANCSKSAKEAIDQFKKEGHELNYISSRLLSSLSQGDFVSNIPFFYYDDKGDLQQYVTEGMIISTSCHIDQKEYLNIVPVLPIKFYKKENLYELKTNKIFNYMYIPNTILKDKFVDFTMVNTYNKDLLLEGIKKGKVNRLCSLNQLGYYLFIIKLTVFLMRKEDPDTMASRDV